MTTGDHIAASLPKAGAVIQLIHRRKNGLADRRIRQIVTDPSASTVRHSVRRERAAIFERSQGFLSDPATEVPCGCRAKTPKSEIVSLSPQAKTYLGMPAIVSSPGMRQLIELAERIAQSNAAVLITGESGSGKELIARAVHHYSLRCAKPWVDVSCAALPEHLVESELFGYEKGAFSGADSPQTGPF